MTRVHTQIETWTRLGALTAGLVRSLEPHEQQNEERNRKAARYGTDKQRAEDQREYVDYRLRELAAWERGLGIWKKDRTGRNLR